ncbi:MAG: ABC transporter ATP-binding protein/permease [Clostridiales bacterium]|nr:ABC transporter ATP-binding protein/permease [Clostridiales bacterium]
MKLLFKYLKSFAFALIVCLALLFGQAMADLSLPNLMSDIVNVGIQKNGIEEKAPKAISSDGFRLMQFFMSDADREIMASAYFRSNIYSPFSSTITLRPMPSWFQDFPLLTWWRNEGWGFPLPRNDYFLDDYLVAGNDPAKLVAVENAYGKAALAFINFMRAMTAEGGEGSFLGEGGLKDVDITEVYEQLLPFLSSLPPEAFADAIAAAEASDPQLWAQAGSALTMLFYEELGADLSSFQQSYIVKKGLLMLLVALAGVAAAVCVGFFASRIATSVAKSIRRDIFAKVESFGSHEFDKFSTASLITRTTNDVQHIQMLILMGIRMICYAPILGVGGVIMALGKSPSMAWIIAVAVLVLVGLIASILPLILPRFQRLQKLIDRLNLVSRETLSGIMVIRAFGNQKHEEGRFEKAARDLRDTERYTQRVMALMVPLMTIVMNGTMLAIVWIGAHKIAESSLQIGDMMAFMQYAMQIIMSFLMMSMMFIMMPRAFVSAKRVAEVLATRPGITDQENPKHLPDNGGPRGLVRFDRVSFRYHEAEEDVLKDISFTARPGETTAFIGSTGSGKSTLINLIPRFHDVSGGAIEIDGVNIKDLAQHELREAIGYVPQKGLLFSGDIESNILYGKEDATAEEIAKAIEVAQAAEFVAEAEKGLQTVIAQGGGNVSGGQRQRLAIARALVKKPPIYIFDDSFSALDFKTDTALRKALKEYTGHATVLVVAQRVSTIMNAEQIIVLEAGAIVGKGTHRELLETCPAYREIAESQLAKEELA